MEAITLGAQTGGVSASDATRPHFLQLRKLLRERCPGPYSPTNDEFAIVLRIDGDISYWNFEGCQKLRISRKGRYVTIDVGVPRHRWEGVSPIAIRHYLAESCREAMRQMIQKLQNERIAVDSDRLMQDVDKALVEFLAESDKS